MKLSYRHYVAQVYYSAEVDVFYGEVINCEQLIVFQTSALEHCKEALSNIIEFYEEFYESRNNILQLFK